MKEKELEKTFKALANKRRLLILGGLKKHKEMPVGEIASEIKLSFRSTSKHLKVLTSAGLVESEQRSKQIFYRLAPQVSAFTKSIVTYATA